MERKESEPEVIVLQEAEVRSMPQSVITATNLVSAQKNLKEVAIPKKLPLVQKIPFCIGFLCFLNSAFLAATLIKNKGFESYQTNPFFGASGGTLIYFGAKYGPSIRLNEEYYR